ncbi:hypothetical protein B0H12DRAFT_1327598 [Mycena haematopus]|nr:hypothetical protein B0H12DRAFT_1327598 [Mycena haematopus]
MLSIRAEDRERLRVNQNTKTPGRENNNANRAQLHGKPLLGTQATRTAPATGKKPISTATPRPLGDKTPFANRNQTLVLENTPPSGPRPSSARTHLRAPRTSHLPIEAPDFSALQFHTPATNGRPWDVSPLAPSPLPLPVPLAVDVDDHDEVEYMPPKVELQPWAPPDEWAMPDYKELGSALRARAEGWAWAYGDDGEVGIEVDAEFPQVEMPVWALPELDPLLDDPFAITRAMSSTNAASTVPASKTRRPLATMSATTKRAATTTTTRPPGVTQSTAARTVPTTSTRSMVRSAPMTRRPAGGATPRAVATKPKPAVTVAAIRVRAPASSSAPRTRAGRATTAVSTSKSTPTPPTTAARPSRAAAPLPAAEDLPDMGVGADSGMEVEEFLFDV